ncbi:serine protease [Acidiphilium sp. AL]|uniref:S1 family peptidase n=1 Tax=Acidiphilium sp. AL TaxID=2871704 RepID=UPI0021CB6B90|nr:serine protease [Acidiphilium sp. AL]MCU4160870.1 serine protease [Acidiphilium sp. AL]
MANLLKPSTLAEHLNFAVLRIVAANHQTGSAQIGTGYVCVVKFAENLVTHVLITNKHVVDGANLISFDVHLATGEADTEPDSETVAVNVSVEQVPVIWHPHCDLVAIMITPAINAAVAVKGRKPFVSPLPAEVFMTNELAVDLDIVEPITMVGYPSGLWDEQNKLPLFRRGFTASHPAIDFNGKPEFSVDIAVFSGSSGSPVFLIERGLLLNKGDTAWSPKERFWFLGTLWGGPRMTEKGEIRVEPVPSGANIHVETGIRMHLGWVIKAKETRWLLDEVKVFLGRLPPGIMDNASSHA